MQVNSTSSQNQYVNSSNRNNTTTENYGLSASNFMKQVDPEIAKIFEDLSVGLDDELKLKRAMSLSLHFSQVPLFKDGNFPEGMPEDVKAGLRQDLDEWNKLTNDKDRTIYKLDWMINRINHKQSSDPAYEDFLKNIHSRYTGVEYDSYKTRDEINEADVALQQFKKDLTTKGAMKFLHDYNMEKIEKMIEEYREKLLKALGENPTTAQLNELEEMLSNYKKELLEKLNELNDKEKKSALNINRIEFDTVNNLNKNLEKLMQD